MTLASFIELIAKIKQKNNGTFKLVDAQDVECEDGKGLDEVLNEKLDKNQGVENVGKTMVVGDDGNLVVGDSSPKNVYTKEEVDYLLDDKMDKPYVPIEITDSTTLNDCLAGNFKIDKIKGNTYQNVETDIKPTPERPVPINSRKVKANGEYVELRSLKETGNLFDLGLLSRTELMETSGSYRKINIPIKLKPNTRYKIYYEKSMIPALKWVVLNIVDNTEEKLKFAILNVRNKENNEVEKQAINMAFTSPNDGEIYFSYYVQSYNTEGDLVPQTTETFKEKWFTKILKNIMVTEESLNQNTYVPPTVRDYKIVDHANKTAKIVRNVGKIILDETKDYKKYGGGLGFYLTINDMVNNLFQYPYGICEIFETVTSIGDGIVFGINNNIIYGRNVFDEVKEVEQLKEYFASNNSEVLYPLATLTEETIAYVETDTSEIGYSWQDTTSPSPDVPSEIKGVEKIDILKTGKNLFDIKSHEFTTNLQNGKVSANIIVKVNDTTLRVQNPNVQSYAVGDKFVVKANEPLIISFDVLEITGNELINVVFYKETGSLLKSFEYKTIKVGTRFVIDTPITTRNNYVYIGFQSVDAGSIVTISNILLEHASIATEYEPYKEQHINITPPQPLYENDIANVESGNYEYEEQKYIVTGDEEFYQDYQNQAGYYGRYFNLKNGNGILTEKIWCNYLSYIQESWSLASEGCSQNGRNQIHLKFSNDRLGITDNTPLEEKRLAFANYLKQLYASGDSLYVVVKVAKTTQPIPEEDLAKMKSLKTNAGVNNIFVGGEVKPTIEARYPRDLALVQQQLEQKILLISDSLIDTQAKVLLQGGQN